MNWVHSASDVEIAQMKLIYASMYVVVGLMPLEEAKAIKVASLISQFDDGDTPEASQDSQDWQGSDVLSQPVKAPLHKRFRSVDTLVPCAAKPLWGLNKTKILRKWRWMYRDNSDKMVLRYIRQMGCSKKVMSAIGETLATYFGAFDPEVLLRQGEAHYVFDKPSPRMMQQHEVGKRTVVGHDKRGRPLNLLTARRSFASAQSYEEMEKYSRYILELTYMMCQDDVDGAVVIFDMQGFKRENMDLRIMRFILTQLNKFYPMILHRFFIYRAPLTMQAMYKVLYTWLDPNLRKRVRFISKPDEMLAVIDSSQLPPQLGGTSTHKHVWIPPSQEDDAPMRDTKTRKSLQEKRDSIVLRLEQVTKEWVVARGAQAIAQLDNKRQAILEEHYKIYWQLDAYVRSRTVFDRNGIFASQRHELKAVPQPAGSPAGWGKGSPGSLARANSVFETSTLVSTMDSMSISSRKHPLESRAHDGGSSARLVL